MTDISLDILVNGAEDRVVPLEEYTGHFIQHGTKPEPAGTVIQPFSDVFELVYLVVGCTACTMQYLWPMQIRQIVDNTRCSVCGAEDGEQLMRGAKDKYWCSAGTTDPSGYLFYDTVQLIDGLCQLCRKSRG